MLPPQIQVVLFSATFPDEVVGFAKKFAPNSNEITLRHEELTVEGIKQLYIDCPGDEQKYETLVKLYGLMTIGSSIIFVKVCKITSAQATTLMRCSAATLRPRLRGGCRPRDILLPRSQESSQEVPGMR